VKLYYNIKNQTQLDHCDNECDFKIKEVKQLVLVKKVW